MNSPDAAARGILVIGYGNTLRGDDGVGPFVAVAVSKWQLPGVIALERHQLTAELAEPVARAAVAIFVDARLDQEAGAGSAHMLEPSDCKSCTAHASDPCGLLALANAVYGHSPAAWLVSVPGVDFSVREGLSATASRGAARRSRESLH